ncbi:prolyl oligopeptidase family protein [Asticcacaulis biprosthecium C19]|uniref:Prolyl oligopeptidase family protein n=1 Tax=Asticcacaulis biprosthecium C19 TaxID=715226 RepID=F4QNW9_9CAUL|nr:alpha/beta hydrolase [Asticcacaulis biprosthecium]EGF91027.1 prolyl oligopeptidase family protein [Asticcacaulis biprosthecium C19]
MPETLILDPTRNVSGDLYLPEATGPHPVLVAVHGGGWRRGSPKAMAQWGRFFAQHGVAVLAVSYRLTTSGPVWPENLNDVLAALRWVQASGASHGLDPNCVGLLGASAGAHLSALAALTNPPRVLIGVYGCYDLLNLWQADLIKNLTAAENPTVRMLGGTPLDDPRRYFEASPISHVSHAARSLRVQLIHGDHDDDIDVSQTQAFALRLRQAGALVQTVIVPGAGHLWFSSEDMTDPTSHCAYVAPRLLAFVKQFLVTP